MMSWNKAFLIMNLCWCVHEVMFLSPSLQSKRDEHLLKRRNVPNECFCEDSDADGDFRSVRSYTSPLKWSSEVHRKSLISRAGNSNPLCFIRSVFDICASTFFPLFLLVSSLCWCGSVMIIHPAYRWGFSAALMQISWWETVWAPLGSPRFRPRVIPKLGPSRVLPLLNSLCGSVAGFKWLLSSSYI